MISVVKECQAGRKPAPARVWFSGSFEDKVRGRICRSFSGKESRGLTRSRALIGSCGAYFQQFCPYFGASRPCAHFGTRLG